MAKYGYTLYGLRKYSQLDGSELYYNAGVESRAVDYQTVEVSWTSITPDPADPAPTHWRLVRTTFGQADSPEKGTTVDGGVVSQFKISYTDLVPESLSGEEVYYSLWLFNSREWILCGSSATVSVQDSGSMLRLTRRLPAAWLNDSQGVGDATGGAEDTNQLVQFLSGLVFTHDFQRTSATLLSRMSDYKKIPTNLLQSAIDNVGMPYEPALGDTTARTLYRVGHIVNAAKGSARGLRQFASALTHWGTFVSPGRNLMLDSDDSSFEESLGRWVTDNGTLTRELYSSLLVEPPIPAQEYALFPVRKEAYARVSSTGQATLELGHAGMPYTGIPIVGGKTYTFSGFLHQLTPSLTTYWTVTWWGRDSQITYSGQLFAGQLDVDVWKQYRLDVTAPADAVYAELAITVAGDTYEAPVEVLLDMLQFESKTNAIHFQDARTVEVEVEADRTNFLLNPAFDAGTGGWYGKNASIVQDDSVEAVFGASVARIDATASSPAMISMWTPITPGAPYTFSAYVAGTGTAVARIEFTSPQSDTDQTSILSDENGSYFPQNVQVVDSDPITLEPGFSRISVTAQSPTYVADNGSSLAKVSVYFPESGSGDVQYVDACLLEQKSEVLTYFQGNGGPAPVDPLTEQFIALNDCRWEWKDQTNLVKDPLFTSTSDWSANSGTSISSVSGSSYAGNTMMQVDRATSGTAQVTSTIVLEQPIYNGGEDYVLSVRVSGLTGNVTIGDGTTSTTFTVPAANEGNWTQIWCAVTTLRAATSLTFTVSADLAAGDSFYLSAAQVETGRMPRKFVDPSSSYTTSRPNLSDSSALVWDTYQPQDGAGRSHYWARYYDTYRRLAGRLPEVMPLGANWEIISGNPMSDRLVDPTSSLLSASSFESSLDGWSPVSSTLRRVVSRGSHYSEYGANGAAWCEATATSTAAFGVSSQTVVDAFAGYYLSAALKPATTGTAKLKVSWKNDFGTTLWTTESQSVITELTRWTYLGLTDKNIRNLGTAEVPDFQVAVYVTVAITFEADVPAAGNVLLVDRVVFRE